jgi:hypothetical protein
MVLINQQGIAQPYYTQIKGLIIIQVTDQISPKNRQSTQKIYGTNFGIELEITQRIELRRC